MSTSISIVGTVATEPRVHEAGSGVRLCSFRVASNERRYDGENGEWVDSHTNWFGVTAFRALALNAAQSLHKGDRVVVHGRLRVRRWENDEKSGLSVEIDADALGHDLRWGVSRFAKTAGASPEVPQSDGDASAAGTVGASEGGTSTETDGAAAETSSGSWGFASTGDATRDGFAA